MKGYSLNIKGRVSRYWCEKKGSAPANAYNVRECAKPSERMKKSVYKQLYIMES